MTNVKKTFFLLGTALVLWCAEAGATRTAPFTANAISTSTNEDASTTVAFDVTRTRQGRGEFTYVYSVVSPPANGSTSTPEGSTVTYTPVANFNGEDSFTYQAVGARGFASTATVTIRVDAVNDAPTVAIGAVATNEDETASGQAVASDADGDELSYSFSDPAHGSVTNLEGGFTYVPDPNFNGTDSFTVTVTDSLGGSSSAEATVTVAPVAEPWNFSALPLEAEALVGQTGSVLSVSLPSDSGHDVNGGPAVIGPDASGDDWAVFAGESLFAVNLRTGETRVIEEGIRSGATPLAIENDAFQGFVVPMTSPRRGDNGISGTLLISDMTSGSPVNNVFNPAGSIAIDTSVALLSESDSGEFEFVVGSTNSPELYERVIDTTNAGSLFRMNQNGEIVGILNENSPTPIHNWMGNSPTIDVEKDGGAVVLEGTSVGHDGSGTGWNTAGISCSLISFDPYSLDSNGNMDLLSVYDPGQEGCSTAVYTSETQHELDSAMVPEIVPGVPGANATYWGRLFGDPDENDGKDTGIAFQVYRDDPSVVKCTAEWENGHGQSSMDGFYNGLVTDDEGNAFLSLKRTVVTGSRTQYAHSLARLDADDCSITYLYDFSGISQAGTPGLGVTETGQKVVMVAGDNGYLLVFDPDSGTKLASYVLGSTEMAVASPTVTGYGVAVLQKDGTFNVVDAGITAHYGNWPKTRGDLRGTGRMRFE